jgi:hypothetical protein
VITLDGDLLEMVQRWTKDGAMTFRWPSDDEEMLDFAASYWLEPKWDLDDIALEATAWQVPAGIRVALDSVTRANDGPAVEAFVRYMHAVPARNAAELRTSFHNISSALSLLAQSIRAYKSAAHDKLAVLKQELDDNEAWAGWPWRWGEGDEIDAEARRLIKAFQDDLAASDQRGKLVARLDEAARVIAQETPWLEYVAKPLPDDVARQRDAVLGND